MPEISHISQTDGSPSAYCKYYQAHVKDGDATLLVGVLKNVGHICFDRTIDADSGLFEFFVPADQEGIFLAIMDEFKAMESVRGLRELPNRLIDPAEQL